MKMSYLKTILVLVLVLLGSLIAQPSTANNATKELCHPDDKRALLRIQQQSNNTFTTFGTWVPTTDCCNGWFNVQCDSTTNRVNFLSLAASGTEATHFPTALGDLPYLTEIILDNNIVGPIPTSLAKLPHLTSIDFRFNCLSGPIPSFFSTFRNLTLLFLSNNLLTGAIPSSLGLLPNLQFIDLGNNKLTGPIPESFGFLRNDHLVELSLPNNELSGEIPRSFEKAKFFFLMEFQGNKLKGDPSFLFSKDKTALFALNLSNNSFSFDMTNLTFTSRLQSLLLTDNKIFGSLPEGLAELPDLNFFNVSYNQLCGHIPRGNLKKFDITSYLHNKCLCGTPLPHCK